MNKYKQRYYYSMGFGVMVVISLAIGMGVMWRFLKPGNDICASTKLKQMFPFIQSCETERFVVDDNLVDYIEVKYSKENCASNCSFYKYYGIYDYSSKQFYDFFEQPDPLDAIQSKYTINCGYVSTYRVDNVPFYQRKVSRQGDTFVWFIEYHEYNTIVAQPLYNSGTDCTLNGSMYFSSPTEFNDTLDIKINETCDHWQGENRDKCLYNVAHNEFNPEICTQMSDPNRCYYHLATDFFDESLCRLIRNGELYDNCYKHFHPSNVELL